MKTRIISLLLVLVMVLGLAPMTVLAAEDAVEIYTADELVSFAADVNGGNTTQDAVLMDDIDLTGTPWFSTEDGSNNMIGSVAAPYEGTFDGNGYTISGLYIYEFNTDIPTEEHGTGLFGATDGATIKDLTVEGTFELYGQPDMLGRHGSVIGKAVDTELIGVTSKVAISGYGYWYYGSGGYGPNYIGGLVGWGQAVSMDMCANRGDILLYNAQYIAGLIGYVASAETPSTFYRCVNTGDLMGSAYLGGTVGYIEGTTGTEPDTLESCYNTGDIACRTWNRSSDTYAGNMSAGSLMNGFAAGANVLVKNCFTVGQNYDDGKGVTAADGSIYVSATGIAKEGYNDGVTDQFDNAVYYVGNLNISYSNPTLDPGINRQSAWTAFSTPTFVESLGEDFYLPEGAEYPALKWECEHAELEALDNGDGTHTVSGLCKTCGFDTGSSYTEDCADADDNFLCDVCGAYVASDKWYAIADADDMVAFGELVAMGATGVNAKLTADVDLTGIDWTWKGIGSLEAPYAGIFDGCGHTVSGLTVSLLNDAEVNGVKPKDTEYGTGLFAFTNGATIKNLTVEGTSFIYGNPEPNAGHGGIVGRAYETTLVNCISDVAHTGYGYWYYNLGVQNVGGLVGWGKEITMDMCSNKGDIIVYNAGYIGGLIGRVAASDEPSSFTRCSNYGNVVGSEAYGGVMGYMEGTTGADPDVVDSCYNRGNVSGRTWNRGANTYASTSVRGGTLMAGYAADANIRVTNCYTVGCNYDDGNVYTDGAVPSTASGINGALGYNDSVLQYSNVYYFYDGSNINYSYSVESGMNRSGNIDYFKTAAFTANLGEHFYQTADGEFPILQWEHDHDFSEAAYANIGYKKHVEAQKCAVCGFVGGELGAEGECVDNDFDGVCDLCNTEASCKHENVGEPAYTANNDGTHTVTVICDDCGGYVLVKDEAEKKVITMDFKAVAKDLAQQDFWNDLKSYDDTITTNRFIGRISHLEENLPTVANEQAYAALRDYLETNYDWNFDEATSKLNTDLKRMHINSADNVPWGIMYYTYYTGSIEENSKIGFTVYADKAGWYEMDLEAYLINYIYSRRTDDTGMAAHTGDTSDTAGGAHVDVLVNDVLAKHDFSFQGGLVTTSNSMGAVYLNEGANSVVLLGIYSNNETVLQGGRCTNALKSITFTEIDTPAAAPDFGTVVSLSSYLAKDEAVTADCEITSSDDAVATGSLTADGRLSVKSGNTGYAVLTITDAEGLELAHVGVNVAESAIVTCVDADLDGICDDCAAAIPCAHENVTYALVSNGDDTHTYVFTCSDCEEVVEERTFACCDYDDDLVCDLCEGEVTCDHGETTTTYTPNGDKTHTASEACDICKEAIGDSVIEDCVDEDGDNVCDKCEGAMACTHEGTQTRNEYTDNSDGTHVKEVFCACGELIETVTENCADADADGYCDGCEAVVEAEPECDHSNTTTETVSNGDKTHTTTVTCEC
ncbi:MAG: hypothetical protein IJO88_06625, partial [Oscillospiraceae bacterium]|nr:hypothetical protein [Oscillospiraceae bacterium]